MTAVTEQSGDVIEFPASFAQQRMWFLHKLNPADSSYNVPLLLRLRGGIDPDVLAAAIGDLVARQEQLRTSFADIDGDLRQRVHPWAEVPLGIHRVQAAELADAEVAAHPAVAPVLGSVIDAPFDLGAPGAIRVELIELGPADQLLIVVIHHIVVDGWSLRVLLTELDAYYRARVEGRRAELPELAVQYADYAEWERENTDRAALDAVLARWSALFPRGLTGQLVPTDRPRPDVPSSRGSRYEFDIDSATADSVRGLARREGATLYMVLLATWAATVARAGDKDAATISTLLANRENPQLAELIGLFVNTLPVPVDLTGEPSFRTLLSRVRQASMHVYAHQDTPMEEIVKALRREGDEQGDALPLMFALQNFAEQQIRFGGPDIEVTRLDEEERTTRFELELHIWEHPDQLRGALVYSTDLFSAATVARLAETFTAILRHGSADPEVVVRRIPLAEQAVGAAAPAESVTAVGSVGDRWDEPVRRFEAVLHRAGLGAGDVVVTAGSVRSPDTVVAAVATLRRGGVWLPLDARDDPTAVLAAELPDYVATRVFTVGFEVAGTLSLPLPSAADTAPDAPPVQPDPGAPALSAAGPSGRVPLDREAVAQRVATLRRWFPGDRTRTIWLGESAHATDILWAASEFDSIVDSPGPAGADLALGTATELAGFDGTALVVGASGPGARGAHILYGDEATGWVLRLRAAAGAAINPATEIAEPDDAVADSIAELSVRDRWNTVVPYGFRGNIHIAGRPSGLRGVMSAPGRLRVDTERSDAAVWTGRRSVSAALVRDRLRELGPLREVAVTDRVRTDGAHECIAYVTRTASIEAEAVLRRLRATTPHDLTPTTVVTLPAALPLTTTGVVDVAALRRIPVHDRIESERLTEIATTAGATTVTVTRPEAPPAPRLAVPQGVVPAAEHVGDRTALLDGGPQPDPRFTSLPAALAAAAGGTGGVRHLRADSTESVLPYRELLSQASSVAGMLIENGCRRGDPVLVQCRDTEDFVVAVWAALLAGASAVPLATPADYDPATPAAERLSRIWTVLDRPTILAGRHEYHSVREHSEFGGSPSGVLSVRSATDAPSVPLPVLDLDDVALLMFTSGSTGEPKGVRLTHGNILRRGESLTTVEDFDAPYVSFNWMPLDHVGGIVMWHLRDVYHGVDQIHAPTDWILADPLRWLDVIDRYRVTSTWAPNFAFGLVTEQVRAHPQRDWDLSTLRMVLNGGEAIAPRVAAAFVDRLSRHGLAENALVPAWGMSETSSGVVYSRQFRTAAAWAESSTPLGAPIPGCRIRIVDDADIVRTTGVAGRLQVAGGTVTAGYYGDPAQYAEAFTADSWFDTGDLGIIDAEGTLRITGRAKDVIIVNGVNYPCHEIESAVDRLDCTLTSWSAACAVRDGDAEGVAVFVRLTETAESAAAISAIRAAVVAAVGISPTAVVPLPDGVITKTSIGKIARTVLREQYDRGDFDAFAARRPAAEGPAVAGDTVTDHFYQLEWVGARAEFGTESTAGFGTESTAAVVLSVGVIPGAPPHTVVVDDADPPARVLANLAAALSRYHAAATTAITVLTRSAFAVDGPADPVHAACAALLETARAEFEDLIIRHIDTTAAVSAAETGAELDAAPVHPVVALRAARLVPRLRHTVDPLDADPPAPGELYLVTGGRGGVGELVTAHLRRRYGLRLLVVGRSPATPGDDGVRHVSVDRYDADRLRAEVAGAEAHFGRPLAGIMHLAGHFAEQALPEISTADFEAALDAKAATAAAAMRLGADRPGLRWIGFSSVNATFGGAHAGAYAAAGAYLDALTSRFVAAGHRAQSIGWSSWDGVGLSRATRSTASAGVSGYRALDPAEALMSLDICLRRTVARPLVGLDPAAARIAALLDTAPRMSNHVVLQVDGRAQDRVREALGITRDRFGTRLRVAIVPVGDEAASDATDTTGVGATIATVFGQVLGLDDCGIHDNFFDLGGSSVTAIRAHATLTDRLGGPFPLAELYRSPTPYLLARAVRPATPPRTAADRVAARAQRRRARAATPSR